MFPTKPLLYRHPSPVVNQVLAVMIQDRPFDAALAAATRVTISPWTTEIVSEVLRATPRFFFQPIRSIGHQSNTVRHRPPLRQRNLQLESQKLPNGSLLLGPSTHRDPIRIHLGLSKSIQFFYRVESHFEFTANESTIREMAVVTAKANRLRNLWDFLKKICRRGIGLVSTSTVTCLIKVLGEEGLVNQALCAFYRMKQLHCKPDVYAYNTVIYALCRVGFFKKARFLLEQMELPGFRCPPDKCTYTIMIGSYCKHSLLTGSRKAIRRRLWEANHLIGRALELFEDTNKRSCAPNGVTYNSFIRYYCVVDEIDKAIEMLKRMREMNHGIPTTSSYTPIIHALCEAGRVVEARDFLANLVDGGSNPREYTYTLNCDALDTLGGSNLLDDEIACASRRGTVMSDGAVEVEAAISFRQWLRNNIHVVEGLAAKGLNNETGKNHGSKESNKGRKGSFFIQQSSEVARQAAEPKIRGIWIFCMQQ
ncbi:hypothetical protein Nepgr_002576 [Nepenthes gracilis]|uniref:Pentatricopeptide repeat-containing protein n=1 Tax=Nepenthes gracilis TaxID=150966 RepID=A0AAD3RX03_NEPGR|nr:hypothetical protein Nepgr_002576 [Nepenthes gracilis]